jgi:HupE / UreJ protein
MIGRLATGPAHLWLAFRRFSLCAGLLVLLCGQAMAHKASDAYLQLSSAADSPSVSWQLSVALRDLDAMLESLDQNNDRNLTWGEIQHSLPAIKNLITEHLQTQCDQQAMPLGWTFESLEQRSDGVYTRWSAASTCQQGNMGMRYTLLQSIDATHRLLVAGALRGQAVAAVVSPHNKPLLTLAMSPVSSSQVTQQVHGSVSAGFSAFAQFFPEGVHHLATGYDHLAFLLALLLPITLLSRAVGTQDSGLTHRPGVWSLLRTVTAFTVGHSVTLVLASLGWIASPAWVEPVIAISIGVSALLNLYPQRWLRPDYLALGFGLIHGLGFSNIMREAHIHDSLLPWALAGFNLGVEAGQLVGVAIWCAVSMVLAQWRRYEQVIVRGGSWALSAVALYWTAQRLMGS